MPSSSWGTAGHIQTLFDIDYLICTFTDNCIANYTGTQIYIYDFSLIVSLNFGD